MPPGVGTTHHIKLGDEHLIVRPNTYQKSPSPTFGARIATGDPDYNNLSIWQHWVQHCWVGGMPASEWVDDAMFKGAVGINTTTHERATLSRQLKRGSSPSSWTLGGGTEVLNHQFVIFDEALYVLVCRDSGTNTEDSRLYRYNSITGVWTSITMYGGSFWARCITVFDGKLFVGGLQQMGFKRAGLYWTTNGNATPTWTIIPIPASIPDDTPITAMRVYNSKMYVCYNTRIWRMLDTFDKSGATTNDIWDGGTQFYKVNQNTGSNHIVAMETHLGFLYMLSKNGHLHRTDGNNTFDIWSWDGQTRGVSLRSYDGKLFVGTYEYTDSEDWGEGVLYQFTGAAVTELKRWGSSLTATSIGGMMVYDRKLYYGASGLFGLRGGMGVAVYDAVEDGHSIYAVNDDVGTYPDTGGSGQGWIVDDVIAYKGKLFMVTRKHGVFYTEDSFRDEEIGRAQYLTSGYGGVLESSLYDGGTPGLQKLWRKVTVWCDLPAETTMRMDYSTDGGVNWVQRVARVGATPGPDQHVFYLPDTRSTRFQWRITLKSTNEAKSPILRSVVVAYLPQPEPNWSWSFVVPVADKWELLDKTIVPVSTNTLIAYLEGLYRSQALVPFTDIDGKKWASDGTAGVLVYDLNVVHYDIENPREADVRITLLETVETYE